MAAPIIKKAVVAVATNKKLRNKILGIILGVIIILFMPLAAILAIFNGNVSFDVDRLQEIYEDNLSQDEKEHYEQVEKAMNDIDDKMTEKGYGSDKIQEAQMLYTVSLSDESDQSGIVDDLVSCFSDDKDDEEFITDFNEKFGKEIKTEEYQKMVNPIRSVYISTASYTDPATKNNRDVVEWAKYASDQKWGYVTGTYGEVLSKTLLDSKCSQYPEQIEADKEFIETNWLNKRTADCIGLIKGYAWYNAETEKIIYASNGMPDIGTEEMFSLATKKGTIDSIPDTPGLGVYHTGHVGIYIGGGKVVQAANTQAGVITTNLSGSGFTHWFEIPHIKYLEDSEETTN